MNCESFKEIRKQAEPVPFIVHKAVKAFQKANGLTVDVIVGKDTWGMLLT